MNSYQCRIETTCLSHTVWLLHPLEICIRLIIRPKCPIPTPTLYPGMFFFFFFFFKSNHLFLTSEWRLPPTPKLFGTNEIFEFVSRHTYTQTDTHRSITNPALQSWDGSNYLSSRPSRARDFLTPEGKKNTYVY